MGTFLLLAGGLFVIIAVVVVVASVSSVIGAVAGEVEDSDEDQDYYNTIFIKDKVSGMKFIMPPFYQCFLLYVIQPAFSL